jgi:hypothetical protein
MGSTAIALSEPADWKAAVVQQLHNHKMSRYQFVRACAKHDLCAVHTAECLLADPDTTTGQRIPSLQNAIDIARLAGFDVVLVPKRFPGEFK